MKPIPHGKAIPMPVHVPPPLRSRILSAAAGLGVSVSRWMNDAALGALEAQETARGAPIDGLREEP